MRTDDGTCLQVVTEGRVAIFTLNRPQALNALNRQLLETLDAALARLEQDPEVRCLVITGAGERAFVAGADIAEMRGLAAPQARALSALGQRVFARLSAFPWPSLAAVNGFALGGGCELAMACDLIYAAEEATFGLPEVKLGLVPGFAGTSRLPQRIGQARASLWIWSGATQTAAAAQAAGLVLECLPRAALLPHVLELAAQLAAQAPLALLAAKRLLGAGGRAQIDRAAPLEQAEFAQLFATADGQEGLAAFLGRRPPQFGGH